MTAAKYMYHACTHMKTFMKTLQGLNTISVEIIAANGTIHRRCEKRRIAKQIIDKFAVTDPDCRSSNCFTSFTCSGVRWYAGAGHGHGPVIAVESSFGACSGEAMIRPCHESWGGYGKKLCSHTGAESQTLSLNVYYV